MEELAAIYLVIVPIVLVGGIVEALWLMHAKDVRYDWKAWWCSLADLAGRRMLSLIPLALTAPWLAWAWNHRFVTQSLDNVWSLLLLLVGLEFFYYWYHRASHTVRWFWTVHSVHHSPNQLNLAAAYRLGWFGKFTGATLFFTPLVLLGFEPHIVLSALLLNLMYQFWLHAAWIPKLGWLEYAFNTPSHHRVHHARNPEYLDANYGGVLIVFDRLFGTCIEERDNVPCDYGLVSPKVTSRNPFVVNVMPFVGLVRDLASVRSPLEAWMYLFGPPGWRPDGQGLTTTELRARAALARAG